MSHKVDLNEIERSTFRESVKDGVIELAIGICLVAMSGRLLSRVLIVTLVFPLFLPRVLVLTLRKRFTYPRIGYVKLTPDNAKEVIPGIFLIMLVLIAIMALALLLFGDIGNFDLWVKWCPALFGAQLAGLFLFLSSKSGLGRYTVFASWCILSGLASSILNFKFRSAGVFIFFLSVGAALALWGLVLFIHFLRNHPLSAEERISAHG